MKIKQDDHVVSVCITGNIDYFHIETIESCLKPLFSVLRKYNTHMTIAVSARAVENYPKRAEYILKQGQEIAVLGDVNQPFYGSVEEQVNRLEKAKRIYKKTLGIIPTGFRAPKMLHNKNTYNALVATNFIYDSSQTRNESHIGLPLFNKYLYNQRLFSLAKPFLSLAASIKSHTIPANPYFLFNDLVEIPVTGPADRQLIIDKKGPRYSPTQSHRIASIWLDILHDMQKRKRHFFVMQVHPYIVSPNYIEAIDIFLESISCDKRIKLELLGNVTERFIFNEKNRRLIQHKGQETISCSPVRRI